jgi:hypothetical protein
MEEAKVTNRKHYTFMTVLPLLAVISYFCLVSFALTALAQTSEVEGQACYTYGDNETLINARQLCFNLAKRDAIERYCTLVRSESLTRNYQLEKDVVDTLAAGFLRNIKVIEKTEKGREICYRISGIVDESAVKDYFEKKAATPHPQPEVVPATPQRLTDTQFYASKKSNKYHYPSCRWAKKIKPANLIIFSSVGEAKRAGYIPCKVCRPPG